VLDNTGGAGFFYGNARCRFPSQRGREGSIEKEKPTSIGACAVATAALSKSKGKPCESDLFRSFVIEYKEAKSIKAKAGVIQQYLEGTTPIDINGFADLVIETEPGIVSLVKHFDKCVFRNNPAFVLRCAESLSKESFDKFKLFLSKTLAKNVSDDLFCFSVASMCRDKGVPMNCVLQHQQTRASKYYTQEEEREKNRPFLICQALRNRSTDDVLDYFKCLPLQMKRDRRVLSALSGQFSLPSLAPASSHSGLNDVLEIAQEMEGGKSFSDKATSEERLEDPKLADEISELLSLISAERQKFFPRLFREFLKGQEEDVDPFAMCEMLGFFGRFLREELRGVAKHLPLTEGNLCVYAQSVLYGSVLSGGVTTQEQDTHERKLYKFLEEKHLLEKGKGYEGFEQLKSPFRSKAKQLGKPWVGKSGNHLGLTCLHKGGGELRLRDLGQEISAFDYDICGIVILIDSVCDDDLLETVRKLPEEYKEAAPVLLVVLDKVESRNIVDVFSIFPEETRKNDHVMCRAIRNMLPDDVSGFLRKFVNLHQASTAVRTMALKRLPEQDLWGFIREVGPCWINTQELAFFALGRIPLEEIFDVYQSFSEILKEDPDVVMLFLFRLASSQTQQDRVERLDRFLKIIECSKGNISDVSCSNMLIEHAPEDRLLNVCAKLSKEVMNNYTTALKLASRVTNDNVLTVYGLVPSQFQGNLVFLKETFMKSGPSEGALTIFNNLPEADKEQLKCWLVSYGWDPKLSCFAMPADAEKGQKSSSVGGIVSEKSVGGCVSEKEVDTSASGNTPFEGALSTSTYNPQQQERDALLRKLSVVQNPISFFKEKLSDSYQDDNEFIRTVLERCKDVNSVVNLYKTLPGNKKGEVEVAKILMEKFEDPPERERITKLFSKSLTKQLSHIP